jgi:hypothetical protein
MIVYYYNITGGVPIMNLDMAGVDAALSALGEHLERSSLETIELVVCGGSALEAIGLLVDRTTKDVDVLALGKTDQDGILTLASAEPMPDVVREAARIVARDLELPEDWLNPGPTDLLREGLPEGLVLRLHSRRYGDRLVVHFIDRFDQICFKAYAAINGGAAYHLADLTALEPSSDEMLAAASWCLTQDASEVFPLLVRSFLEKVGYPDVARELETRS